MKARLSWDEAKRQSNLLKHGFDFADAGEVLSSRFRLDIPQQGINGVREVRTLSISYALGFFDSYRSAVGGTHRT